MSFGKPIGALRFRELRERIELMQQKERTTYACKDYLQLYISYDSIEQLAEYGGEGFVTRKQIARTASPDTVCGLPVANEKLAPTTHKTSIDEHVRSGSIGPRERREICEWCYRVVDHLEIDREVVSIAMSFVDRFLSVKPVCSTKWFKLVCMVSLFLAAKVSCNGLLSYEFLLYKTSRGEFSFGQMVRMELYVLVTIGWYVHPPTSAWYIRELFSVLSKYLDEVIANNVLSHSYYFSELAVLEYKFVTTPPSIIAFASVLNALEEIDPNSLCLPTQSSPLLEELSEIMNYDTESQEVKLVQRKLRSSLLIAMPSSAPQSNPSAPFSPHGVTVENVAFGQPDLRKVKAGAKNETRSVSSFGNDVSSLPNPKKAKKFNALCA